MINETNRQKLISSFFAGVQLFEWPFDRVHCNAPIHRTIAQIDKVHPDLLPHSSIIDCVLSA